MTRILSMPRTGLLVPGAPDDCLAIVGVSGGVARPAANKRSGKREMCVCAQFESDLLSASPTSTILRIVEATRGVERRASLASK